MITVFIILAIIALVAIVATTIYLYNEDGIGVAVGAFVLTTLLSLFILLIPFLMSFRWQVSDDTYTGYIYSRDSSWGYTTYHIRFSQNAGEDKQPSFTVKSGSEQESEFDKLVGTDEKVKVRVPSASPKMVNNIFEPSSFAELVKEK